MFDGGRLEIEASKRHLQALSCPGWRQIRLSVNVRGCSNRVYLAVESFRCLSELRKWLGKVGLQGLQGSWKLTSLHRDSRNHCEFW
jgi:hypothetical protein